MSIIKEMCIIYSYFKIPAVKISALLYFICAGILTQVPLFNYLGYESSAIIALFSAFISGMLTIHFLSDHLQKPLTRRTWLFVIGDYLHINFLLLLIPLVVISANALVIKNCSFLHGISFYVLLPLATMFFSVSLAAVVTVFFKKTKTIFVILIVSILLHIVVIGYTKPQLFAYNFVLGYFPGITYDETLHDLKKLILFREFSIVMSLLLFIIFFIALKSYRPQNSFKRKVALFFHSLKKDRKLSVLAGICFAIVSAGFLFRDSLGFEFSSHYLQKELGRRAESEHFVFYFSTSDFSSQQMQLIKAEAEFHYDVLTKRMEITHSLKEKISVYIFSTSEQKLHFIGTATTNIAKPWKKEIHLTVNSFQSSFRHELVHILAAHFGVKIIDASPYMALNEGLAVAMDWNEGMFTPHHYAAALLRDKKISSLSEMFTLTGFAALPSSYAYLVSGSFTKYLIERFGMNRFKHLFATAAFMETYGKSLDELFTDWVLFLKKIDITDMSPETIRILFSQQSIFQKECARELAERNSKGFEALQKKDYALAEKYFLQSLSDAKTTTSYRGLLYSFIAQKKYSDAISLYNNIASLSVQKIHPAILIPTADARYLQGNSDSALAMYQTLLQLNISESITEAVAVRKILVQEKIPNEVILSYFYTEPNDSVRLQRINLALLHNQSIALKYLKSLVLYRLNKKQEALEVLTTLKLNNTFGKLNYFISSRAGELSFELHRFEDAKYFFWNAKNYALTASLLNYIDEKIELCDFALVNLE